MFETMTKAAGDVRSREDPFIELQPHDTAAGQHVQDTEMTEDKARPEVTFCFTVFNCSNLQDRVSILSPPFYVRALPWKIMVISRSKRWERKIGFFLQCNHTSKSLAWMCPAEAELFLYSHRPNVKPVHCKIQHVFHSVESDWGYWDFIDWNYVRKPEKGYVKNDSMTLKLHMVANMPRGISWDSKKYTGYVGLKNQGATCYMNSLLQTLYFTNELRRAIYKMPAESNDSSKSVVLALQWIFHELQFSKKPVCTKKLTKSFGWQQTDSSLQQDVQEFLRFLLTKLESKMRGTCVEDTVPKLFEGRMMSYIRCKNVNYTSTRFETFYDIQLNIKGKKNIYESFRDYIKRETLDGDNKYDAGEYGLQDAEKGVIFESFPPILYLHLLRFVYDPITNRSYKFNDPFEFYDHISLDDYLQKRERTPANYTLHAVLVHSGDYNAGHYVVFINPRGDGKWCKFDDDVVSFCSKDEAIEHNYGSYGKRINPMLDNSANAYMLVYIRDSELLSVLQDVTDHDIPDELAHRFAEEKRLMECSNSNSLNAESKLQEVATEQHVQDSDMSNDEAQCDVKMLVTHHISKLIVGGSVVPSSFYLHSLPALVPGINLAPERYIQLSLCFFLQYNGWSWSCYIFASLFVHSRWPDPHGRQFHHMFGFLGFSDLIHWIGLMGPEKCYIMDDSIKVVVIVVVDTSIFSWGSKKRLLNLDVECDD